jgi:hypothetical protein
MSTWALNPRACMHANRVLNRQEADGIDSVALGHTKRVCACHCFHSFHINPDQPTPINVQTGQQPTGVNVPTSLQPTAP